ncbi:MAG: caspase family protein [Eubacteriales bacterium]|nr:caspase family protein [Eubacteriales bacterium]
MRARWLLLFLCLCVAALPLSHAAGGTVEAGSALRALLISSDRFVTMPETTPSSFNNVVNLRRALLEDARGYRAIRATANQALDAGEFAALAREALGEAREGDISLIYLSSHGLLTLKEGRMNFALLLSDGVRETTLDTRAIYEGLKDIKGIKVLILDACYSGAAIHKGDEALAVASLFTGDDFKVLTSTGAREPSILWTGPKGTLSGGSYFAQAMVQGLGAQGSFAADANRDGVVTLAELLRHQRLYYGASSPQLYPEGDPLPVFTYTAEQMEGDAGVITDLVLNNPLLGQEEQEVRFSYTLNQPARVAYQLVYQRQESWRFDVPQSIAQPGENGGLAAPGRKEAALRLAGSGAFLSGYLLMLLITVEEDRAFPQALPVLAVRQGGEDPGLKVNASPAFAPSRGEEAAFFIQHDGPLALTAVIRDKAENLVAALLADSPTRPLHLVPEGTTVYWNGLTRIGEPAPPGEYTLHVSALVSGVAYTAESQPVKLVER